MMLAELIAGHPYVAAERYEPDAVLGPATGDRQQARAEADGEGEDTHADAAGGEEVSELVNEDEDAEHADEGQHAGHDEHRRDEIRVPSRRDDAERRVTHERGCAATSRGRWLAAGGISAGGSAARSSRPVDGARSAAPGCRRPAGAARRRCA